MSFGCTTCLALEFGSEDGLRALVVYQAQQIDRLTGGRYDQPAPELVAEPAATPAPSLVAVLEAALWTEFRKPPRVAAPNILRALADAGYLQEPAETELTG